MIQVKCPNCHAQFQADDSKSGQHDKCPKCGAVAEVPLTLAAPTLKDRPGAPTLKDRPAAAPAVAHAAKIVPSQPPLKIEPTSADEGEEIGLSDEPKEKASGPEHATTDTGLAVTTIGDAAVVDLAQMSILEAPMIEAISNELNSLVEQRGARKVILDFTQVKFLSSQMLGVLVSLHKKTRAVKGRLILCSLRPELMRVFAITRLEKVLEIVENQARAKALLGIG